MKKPKSFIKNILEKIPGTTAHKKAINLNNLIELNSEEYTAKCVAIVGNNRNEVDPHEETLGIGS